MKAPETPQASMRLLELVKQVQQGEISGREAIKLATRPETSASLTDDIALAISHWAREVVQNTDSSWRVSVTLHTLLYAGLDARDQGQGKPLSPLGCRLAGNWLDIVSVALWHVPDPSLYKDALGRGERAMALLREEKGTRKQELASLLHSLGTVHLDPYAAMRSNPGVAKELQAWRRRAWDGETWNSTRYPDIEKEGYPPPAEALAKAKTYYRAAADLREGRERARSLKALVQTLHAHGLFALDVDRDGMAVAAGEALALLNPKEDGPVVAELTGYLRYAGEKADVSALQQWFDQSLDASIAAHGRDNTRLAVIQTARMLLDREPAKVLRLLLDAQSLFTVEAKADQCTAFHHLVLRAFARMHGFQAKAFVSPDKPAAEMLVQDLIRQSENEKWDPARLAGALVAVAEYTTEVDQEHVGVRLIDLLQSIAPVTTASLKSSLDSFRAQLWLNEGVNAVNREDWDGATQYYSVALVAVTEMGASPLIQELLERLADVVRRGGADAATAVARTLFDRTDAIELIGGHTATERLQEIYRLSVDAILGYKGSPDDLWTLVQLAKGRRFAAMIAAGSAHRLMAEDRDSEVLAHIVETRAEASQAESNTAPARPIEIGALLSPYSRDSLRLEGDSAVERLINLEHRYDTTLHERLVSMSAGTSGLLASEGAVRDALEEDTVLLQYYCPCPMNAEPFLVLTLSTRTETRWSVVRLKGAASPMRLTLDGVEVEYTYASGLVQSLREAVNEDPGAEPLSGGARQVISDATEVFFGSIASLLAAYRTQGKSHLCIVAHGPLTYAPLHLLGPLPKTMSGDWTVTYLPSLQLLSTHQGGAALRRRRTRALAAFGLSFSGGPEPIAEAVREAQSVAYALRTEALLEDEATESAVLDALRNSRYVHIASHGEHRPFAPSFQNIRLAPRGDEDGHLYAYKLLGMDLRGLELVTLSACETALGRFDAGDNPQGLAATLFLAGAQTLIGTLWEVETTCSEYFFTALYKRLGDGDAKLDAYRKALEATRKQHPQFRDWGAFYFAGSWR